MATRGNTRIVLLLPEDPDASARAIRAALEGNIGLIISDTIGRHWRQVVTDIAIGAADIHVLEDLRATPDADEIASAVDLIRRKSKKPPVAG